MSDASLLSSCPHCGAEYQPPAATCWLCEQELPHSGIAATNASSMSDTVASQQQRSFTFSIASILILTTLSAVFFGLLMMAPGLAIMLAILSVPAMVRTGLALQRRSQIGKPVSTIQKVFWFISSLTVTTIIATVVVVASVGTFCAVCLTTYGALSEGSYPVAILSTLVVTVGVIVLLVRWIRYRWKRDTHNNE